MHVDECCNALLAYALPLKDKNREGFCIDVGVGTFSFYCEIFSRLGFKTIAVEPLPVDNLKILCKKNNITLFESCLSEIDGLQKMYVGTYKGKEDLNLSSIESDWWGASTETRGVKSMTLLNLYSAIKAEKVTCLKLDVEGTEVSIIRQFDNLKSSKLPDVVMFEYGGGNSMEIGTRGWSQKYFSATKECFKILKKHGYGFCVSIDSTADSNEHVFDLASFNCESGQLFPANAIYGNVIACRGFELPEDKVTSICADFRDNKTLPSVPDQTSYINKLLYFFGYK